MSHSPPALSCVDKAVVLLSGGLDSSTLLHYVIQRLGAREVYALSFHYGQKHRRELESAAWQAKAAQVKAHDVVDMGFFGALIPGGSALTDAALAICPLADLAASDLTQPPTYVPNRNMMLLSVAAAYAEARGVTALFYGAQTQDSYGYWDCTPEFLEKINTVLALNRRTPVTVVAPFVGWRKADEIRIGLELGVDYAHTWTCYRGGYTPCGECPSCTERAAAFQEIGVSDPLSFTG
ncbi:MAG: 7-cyano-7-deazaguanine synthase QueC [bacterium]